MTEREWTEDMGEISGFGGDYEAACRRTLLAGLRWLDEHPKARPQFQGYRGAYGFLSDDNEDAQALSKVLEESVKEHGGATGAMHHAAVEALLYIQRHGWDRYQQLMRENQGARKAQST